MATDETSDASGGKFAGLTVDLLGFGKTRLSQLLARNGETFVYRADHPGVVVKVFDLECGNPEEVSYGPFVAFNLEKENFQDIQNVEELSRCVPAFYGSNIDYERKFAYLAMEFLIGENLLEWCEAAANQDVSSEWTGHFRAAIHETLAIVTRFHRHGIILTDFKPDNVIRLMDHRIKFVDLGAFYTPRHSRQTEKYVYSATPDYSELVIDTSNVQTGIPLSQSSDIFAAGVALFEMTTGRSRIALADETADQMLGTPGLYLFRDTQIRDVWKAYPHLEEVLPLVETQLRERRILFSEIWHLLKGYLALEVPEWESLPELERQEMILASGRTLIAEQLPIQLDWLADAIAQATTLRARRLKSVAELMSLIASPVSEEVRADITSHNPVVRFAEDFGQQTQFVDTLNIWEVRQNEQAGHWAIQAPTLWVQWREIASFTFLKRTHQDTEGHRFYQIVSDLEAEEIDGERLTLAKLSDDHFAWLGA